MDGLNTSVSGPGGATPDQPRRFLQYRQFARILEGCQDGVGKSPGQDGTASYRVTHPATCPATWRCETGGYDDQNFFDRAADVILEAKPIVREQTAVAGEELAKLAGPRARRAR